MEKPVSTALFLIATVIASVAVMNTVIPAVGRGSSAILVSSAAASSRIKTDIEIVFASGDTTTDQLFFWVKNVGTEKIMGIDLSDFFLESPTAIKRIPYNSGAEYWTYSIENGTQWHQGNTIKVTVELTAVETGLNTLKFIVPNGGSASKEFSV